jgi:hypothetical protein
MTSSHKQKEEKLTPGHGFFITEELWIDDPKKPDPDLLIDPVKLEVFKLAPPEGGSVIRVFTFPPQNLAPNRTQEEKY